MKTWLKNKATTIAVSGGMSNIECSIDTPKEPPKSITQQLQEYQKHRLKEQQDINKKVEHNERLFVPTIKPMLDELVNFDNKFFYEFNKNHVVLRYPVGTAAYLPVVFSPNQDHIINGFCQYATHINPNSEATESDRFVFYVKAFFGKYLTQSI